MWLCKLSDGTEFKRETLDDVVEVLIDDYEVNSFGVKVSEYEAKYNARTDTEKELSIKCVRLPA